MHMFSWVNKKKNIATIKVTCDQYPDLTSKVTIKYK